MPYFDFLWPVSAIEHIAEHGITPEEFEDVVLHAERRGESRSSRRPCCWGETCDGRYLFCVYEYADDSTIFPVTAYEVPRPLFGKTMRDFHISPELMRQLEQDRQAIARELPELQVRNARMCKAAAEETLSGHLRRAIHASSRPIRTIADESGIDSDTLCDFLEGTQTLPSDVLDRLTQAVGVAVSFNR